MSGLSHNEALARTITETSDVESYERMKEGEPNWFTKPPSRTPLPHPTPPLIRIANAFSPILKLHKEGLPHNEVPKLLDAIEALLRVAAENPSDPHHRRFPASHPEFAALLSVPHACTFLTQGLFFDSYYDSITNDTLFVLPLDLDLSDVLSTIAVLRRQL